MAGPQFLHLQSFSRKKNPAGQSVEQVLEEAARAPAFSTHVKNPVPPETIFGVPVEEVGRLHDEMISAGSVEVQLKDGRIARRGIRLDRHTLLTAVASYPLPTALVKATPKARADYERWRDYNVSWLKATFGEKLVSVIAHWDEKHPHLHAYILPLDDPACSARHLNPAWLAKEEAMEVARAAGHDDKATLKLGNAAYRARAREIQDDYFEHVGVPCGLTRTGPKRRRLSRQQWAAEKAAAKMGAKVEQDLEGRMVALIEAEDGLDQTLDDKVKDLALKLDLVDQALADAERERKAAEVLRREAEQARGDAKAALAQADVDAERIRQRAENDVERQRQQLAAQNAAALEQDRVLLRDANAKAASEARRLEAERQRLAQDHDRQVRAGVQEAVQLSLKLLLGVLDGTVRQNPETRDWIIEDEQLREKSRSLKLINLMGSALTALRDTWDRLKSKLTDAERQVAREQVEAPLQPVAKAPVSRGFQP